VAYSASPVFIGSNFLTWQINLTGNVTSGHVAGAVPGNLYTFIINQDSAGGHLFVWPDNALNGTIVNPTPNSMTIQTFIADATGTLYAAAPGTYYP
jgi:hypothetical protein